MNKIIFVLIIKISLSYQFLLSDPFYVNPFLITADNRITKIGEFLTSSSEAGYLNQPKILDFYFTLLNKNNLPVYFKDFDRVKFNLIKKNKKYSVPRSIKFNTNNRFQGKLFLPQVKLPGWYDLEIVVSNKKKKISKKKIKSIQYWSDSFNLIFVIDNSLSMLKNDPFKVRFQAINKILKDVNFQKKINRVSVVEFSSQSKIILPITKLNKIRKSHWVTTITNPKGKTNFAHGLLTVNNVFKRLPNNQRNIVIFLSDGENNFPFKNEHLLLLRNNATIFTIGFKNKYKNNNFNVELLKKIAQDTNGLYQEAGLFSIEKIYKKIIRKALVQYRDFLVFPLKKKFFKNELVVIAYQTAKKVTYKVTVNNKLVIRFIEKNNNSLVIPPLPVGEYFLKVDFFEQKRRVNTLQKKIIITDHLAPLTISFPLIINYQLNVPNQSSFFNISSSRKFTFLDFKIIGEDNFNKLQLNQFNFLEVPFQLNKNIKKKVGLQFSDSTVQGNEKKMLLAKTSLGYFGYEINFATTEKKIFSTDSDNKKPMIIVIVSFVLFFFLLISVFLFFRRSEN